MADWDGWRAVLLMARLGTLATAAAALGVDATTAARRLRRLEDALGVRLFERRGTRLRPTAACFDLLPRIETAETALLTAERAFGPGDPGPARTLRLTAVAFLVDHLLAPALPDLLAGRRLRVELLADNRNLSLARREADLALRLGRPELAHATPQRLGEVPYAVYAALDRDPDALPWAGLDDQSAQLPEARWTARTAGARGVAHKASRFGALARLAAAGVARTLLPQIVGDGTPGLVRVGRAGVLAREAWLIGHPEDEAAAHVRAARDWIADTFTRRAQGAG